MVLDSFFNYTLGPIVSLPSPWGVVIIGFLLTLLMTLLYKFMTDQKVMKTLKEEMKELQKEMKELRDQPQEMMKLQKVVMEKNMKYFFKSMKPNLVSIIPVLLLFGWLRKYFETQPQTYFLGLNWFWIYFIVAIISSIVIRKVLKVY